MYKLLIAVSFITAYLAIFALLGVVLFFTPDWPQTSNDSFISVLIRSAEFAIAVLAGGVGLAIPNVSTARRMRRGAAYLAAIVVSFLALGFVGSLDSMHEFFDAFGLLLLVLINVLLAVAFVIHAVKTRLPAA